MLFPRLIFSSKLNDLRINLISSQNGGYIFPTQSRQQFETQLISAAITRAKVLKNMNEYIAYHLVLKPVQPNYYMLQARLQTLP